MHLHHLSPTIEFVVPHDTLLYRSKFALRNWTLLIKIKTTKAACMWLHLRVQERAKIGCPYTGASCVTIYKCGVDYGGCKNHCVNTGG
jgi:hypothetical protein